MKKRFTKPFLASLLLLALVPGTYLALWARARHQAELVRRDLYCLDALTQEFVIMNGYPGGQPLDWKRFRDYLKIRASLKDRDATLNSTTPYVETPKELIRTEGRDALGNHFILGSMDEEGTSVDARTIAALSWAVEPTAFSSGFDGSPKQRPPEIVLAARQGNIPALRQRVASGESLDQTDKGHWTPLAWAAYTDQTEMVRAICSLHPHPQAAINPGRKTRRKSPVEWALNYPELIAFFLDRYHASLEPEDLSDATLHPKTLELLLEHGISANAVDSNGIPIISEAVTGEAESVRLLIAAGANVNVRGYEGQTLLQEARQRNKDEIAAMLQVAGAKE